MLSKRSIFEFTYTMIFLWFITNLFVFVFLPESVNDLITACKLMTDGEGNPVSRDIIDDCLRAIPQEDSRPYD